MQVDAQAREYLSLVAGWLDHARLFWHEDLRAPGLGYYGSGLPHWGIQAHGKFVGALAVLWGDGTDVPDEVPDYVLRGLDWFCRAHVSGEGTLADGRKWGHSWISALYIERLVSGVEAVWKKLPPELVEALARVIASEADHKLTHPIQGERDPTRGKSKGESNLWNGAVLVRASCMFPEHERAEEWRERGILFLVNSCSVPADATDDRLVDGKPLRERHVCANFHPHFLHEHHGFMHTSYTMFPLSNMGMLHYSAKHFGWELPQAAYHHFAETWATLKRLYVGAGRFAHPGGEDWARYAYGNVYFLPVCVFAQGVLKDAEAAAIEKEIFDNIRYEFERSGDGSFMSERLGECRRTSERIYTRLDSDTALCLALAARYRILEDGLPDANQARPPEPGGLFHEPDSRILWLNTSESFSSFSWRSHPGPALGTFGPRSRPHLLDWERNFVGELDVQDHALMTEAGAVRRGDLHPLPGGFAAVGEIAENRPVYSGAGGGPDDFAVLRDIAFFVLDEGRLAVLFSTARARYAVNVTAQRGLNLPVPNDVFQAGRLAVESSSGRMELEGACRRPGVFPLDSEWVTFDKALTVVGLWGARTLTILSPEKRHGFVESLYSHVLCWPHREELRRAEAGEMLEDIGVLLCVSDSRHGREAARECRVVRSGPLRAAWLVEPGCLLLANLSANEAEAPLEFKPEGLVPTLEAGVELDRETGRVKATPFGVAVLRRE